MSLSFEDYKKANLAQNLAQDVHVIYEVKKRTRGWEVLKVLSFSSPILSGQSVFPVSNLWPP